MCLTKSSGQMLFASTPTCAEFALHAQALLAGEGHLSSCQSLDTPLHRLKQKPSRNPPVGELRLSPFGRKHEVCRTVP